MVYLVSNQQRLFESELYKMMSLEDAIKEISSWDIIQFDTETQGRNPHICDILCAQFGNDASNTRIVIDCTTINILKFKELLENKLLVGHNLKFDLQFLYKYKIIPTKVWDTMIVEQMLHLGFDKKFFHYSLHDVAARYLGIDLDKSVRGEIIWRGLDDSVIMYAAEDVVHLENIMRKQKAKATEANCLKGVDIENRFVPVMAYLEWCGIRLDVDKWKLKMEDNEKKLNNALAELNNWLVNKANDDKFYSKYTYINRQGDLFTGFDLTPKCIINWSSSKQVIPIFEHLGFSTTTEDKKTGESKQSITAKIIEKQKGVCDEFLNLYLEYQKAAKECSTYGQNYIDAINPITGRIHTTFWQLGAASGRMSCGSTNLDTDLAKYKNLSARCCIYPQIQNLPADEITRSSFIPNEGNLMTSCDFNSLEARLGADIYNESAMLDEFINGSGDTHSLYAKKVFHEELKDIDVKDVKKMRPDLRKRVKAIEFAIQFGGGAKAVANSLGCTKKEAQQLVDNCLEGFPGLSEYKAYGAQFVKSHGYVTMCKTTGHKMYWEDWHKWKEIEEMSPEMQRVTLSDEELREHNIAGAKWERMSLNSPTQGSGAVIIKLANVLFFKWIVENNLFETVLLCDIVHDEDVIEYPENMRTIVEPKLKECMEKAASVICKKLPIPAEPETGKKWIH